MPDSEYELIYTTPSDHDQRWRDAALAYRAASDVNAQAALEELAYVTASLLKREREQASARC